ncbi:hypothetical protein [Chamaesiphon sp. OTE_20_metabat_361]|nr:hypothetical protein [Chamaesiphon sp. OTE_20_metabat_361]
MLKVNRLSCRHADILQAKLGLRYQLAVSPSRQVHLDDCRCSQN